MSTPHYPVFELYTAHKFRMWRNKGWTRGPNQCVPNSAFRRATLAEALVAAATAAPEAPVAGAAFVIGDR